MKYEIPNLKKILIPRWAHNPGEAVGIDGWKKLEILTQGTIPKDPKLLEKLGIKKSETVLAIAGFYGDWANGLQKKGVIVDYSDVSKSIVNHVKKQKDRKFRRYMVSGYELIPKKPLEYDWTFTYEACGGGRGLPIAYLRSLLNKKGGILMHHYNINKPESMGGKLDRYPLIAKKLAKAYGAKSVFVKKKIISRGRDSPLQTRLYYIIKIITNDKTRELAKKDIDFLFRIGNKKIFNNQDIASIKRLSILAKANGEKMRREVEVK